MAAVARQALTFMEQAWLGLRLFGGVEVLGLFDVVAGEVQAALESLVERWTVKEDMEADEWMRVERGGLREGLRLLTLRCAVSQDLAEVHNEVVKRLRRRQYKDGWEIDF